MTAPTLADRLGRLLDVFDRSVEEAAAAAGADPTAVAAIRDGSDTAPDAALLAALERCFGVIQPYLTAEDPASYAAVQRDLDLVEALRQAGASTVLLRGEANPATSRRLLGLLAHAGREGRGDGGTR